MYRVITTYPGRPEDRFLALQNTLKGIGYPSSLERLEGYARAIQGMVGYCSGLGSGVQGILRGPLSAAATLPERSCYAPWVLLVRSMEAAGTLPGCCCYAPHALLVRSPRSPGTGSRKNSFNNSGPRKNSFNNSAKSGLNRSPKNSGEIERKEIMNQIIAAIRAVKALEKLDLVERASAKIYPKMDENYIILLENNPSDESIKIILSELYQDLRDWREDLREQCAEVSFA